MSYSESGGRDGAEPTTSPPWLQFPNSPQGAAPQQENHSGVHGKPAEPAQGRSQGVSQQVPRGDRRTHQATWPPSQSEPPTLRPVPPYAADNSHQGDSNRSADTPQAAELPTEHGVPGPHPGIEAFRVPQQSYQPGPDNSFPDNSYGPAPQQDPRYAGQPGPGHDGPPGWTQTESNTLGTPNISPFPPSNGQHPGPGLEDVSLLRKVRRPPSRGWRRAVHTLSGGSINPGDSPGDIVYQQLLERLQRPVRGDYRIAVLSLKGGVGKTTTTVGLGSTFAHLRGDRVIAVDANPDLGTLGQRVPLQTRSTVRDLLADKNVYRYSDVRAHTSQAPSRLEVLASERDPAMAEAFSEQEYRGVVRILQRFYNIILTDCGTGLSHSAMSGVLDLANAIILVTSPAIDGARSAGATLDWLQAHGFGYLVSNAVVVISSARPGASTIDTTQLGQHFLTRCRAVHMIPFDDHLSEGADVDLDLVSKEARHAFVELAATIADDFATTAAGADPFLE